ncbi:MULTISPECIES: winged helix-turn-helix domain-containing protein [unclassified Microbacterium]|uniref:winged helix-turn-helix domain-containing protein n=1 Tax=unclassified Microbacterium TaxID=2609290 RepID=UPI000EA9AA99|nr:MULTISPECIES: winged helix-turn-helix domain-containing protein [unclassified Microbacterium]MBT2485913.1 response regulator transcription factor [Microbacterium sp. ISL-108]RKN68666.1 DNA-binding response regulator [Microbacterium sp. CGR2]
MSSPAGGDPRFVLHGRSAEILRGSFAEFRHAGVPITVHAEIVDALADLAHDYEASLVLAGGESFDRLAAIMQIAEPVCGGSIFLGVSEETETSTIEAAMRAGLRGTIRLPITPDRLREVTRLHPRTGPQDRTLRFGELTLDITHRSLRWQKHALLLPPREFELLHQIVRAYPESVSIDTLALAFGSDLEDPQASVRVAMTKLRARLATFAPAQALIETVRVAGYRLAS